MPRKVKRKRQSNASKTVEKALVPEVEEGKELDPAVRAAKMKAILDDLDLLSNFAGYVCSELFLI